MVRQEIPRVSTFIFRPSDVALRGLGLSFIKRLPEELRQSEEVIVTTNEFVIAEPGIDPNVAEIVRIFTDGTASKV